MLTTSWIRSQKSINDHHHYASNQNDPNPKGKLDMGRRDPTISNSNDASFNMPSGYEKPIQRSTSSGLSKPRFVKIRKQNNDPQHGRSSSLSESGFDSGGGSNPVYPVQDNLNRIDDNSRMREIHDQCQSSNAFSFGSTQKDMGFGASGDLNLREFKFGKPDNEGFVFGANSNGSMLNSNLGNTGFGGNVGNSLPDEMRNLSIGSGIGSQNAAFSTEDAFLGRTEDKKSYGLNEGTVSMLPEVMRKLNLESSENVDGVESTKGSDTISCANDRKAFIFGNTGNAADTFGERAEFKLPDEMKKLNMEDSGNVSGVETPFNASFKSDEKSAYVFGNNKDSAGSFGGTTKNRLPGETKKLDMKSNIEDSGFFPDKGFPSSRIFVKDTQPYNAVPTPLVFQTAVLGRSSSTGSKSSDAYMPSSSFTSSGTGFPAYGSLFGGVNQKIEFNTRVGAAKDMGLKKNRGKKKQSTPVQQWAAQYDFLKESSSQENPESPGCYSPMDFSPYQETLATDLGSRETSVAPDDMNCTSSPDAHPSVSTDVTYDDMVTGTQSLNISEDNEKSGVEGSENHSERGFGSECNLEEFVSGDGIESMRSKTDRFDCNSDASFTASEIEAGLCSNIESRGRGDREQFIPASSSEDVSDTSFTFAASTSSQEPLPAAKRHYKKKYRAKLGQDSYNSISDAKIQLPPSTVQGFGLSSSSLVGPAQAQIGDSSISKSIGGNRSEADALGIKQESLSTPAATAAAQEACEKWRLRGNQAYANGNLSKAEDYYTRGVDCVSTNETSESLLRALALCYSNRAATRMSLKRMREALEDCKMAAVIDPNFLRVQVRAANCHLALGEIEDALKYFKRCLQTRGGVSLDKKIVTDASNGLEKTQQVSEYINRCAELLKLKTSNDAERALQIISEALSISPYSEKLFEMKAEALFTLRKYEEVVQLCEQSLSCAETNSAPISADGQLENFDGSETVKTSPPKLWRWRLISMSYFYLGKLEEALDFLEKIEKAGSVVQKYGSVNFESSISLLDTVRELLRHKAAGNEAFQSGKQSEAVEHYTSSLSCNIESRPFAAICFGNRAAAHQALGQITDAIADCSLAIALDGNYPKVILRRAALHEMIKDYGYAASDLQRLISLLEKQAEDKSNQSRTLASSTSTANELTQARLRLSTAEEEAKKGIPLDLYLILGVEPSATASEIRKSYRKAALRHHPDKASQFLARSENGDDGLWKEIAEEVHNDTDRLFKMIGEAYAVLSDPTKRSRYDLEQMKNTQKKGNGSSTPKTSSDAQNYPFEKSGSSRHWQEARRSYGSQYTQWSEASRSSKHF